MEPIPERIAHTIVVDHSQAGRGHTPLFIDGVQVPYALGPKVEVTDIDGFVGCVTVTFYADEVTLISKGGESRTVKAITFEDELEWARREARRIVHEGMADILEWLWLDRPAVDPLSPQGHYALSLDEKTRKALVSTTTHSPSGQQEGDSA